MSNISFIFDEDLCNTKRLRVIELKKQHWQYDNDSQIKWMQDNLKGNDIHVFIEDNEALLSYLNVIKLNVIVENDSMVMYGIGNVCTAIGFLKRGLATELINKTNQFLINTSKSGLLLCHEPLVMFYDKCGWNNITNVPSSVFVAGKEYYLNIMSYNLSMDICGKHIYIDRNF